MSGIADYSAFVVAVIVFLAIPGPGNLVMVLSTSKGGWGAGMWAVMGIILGDQTLLWLAVAGMASVLAASPALFALVQWGGAAYLVYLGLRMAFIRAAGHALPLTIEPRHYGYQAYVITLFNPKAIVFYMAFFASFIDPPRHQGLRTFAAMAATVAGLTLLYGVAAVCVSYFAADTLRRWPKIGQWLTRIAGLVLIGFGVKLIT